MNLFRTGLGLAFSLNVWIAAGTLHAASPAEASDFLRMPLVQKTLNKRAEDFDALFKSDPRQAAEHLMNLAIAYSAEPEPERWAALLEWLQKSLAQPEWGNNRDLEIAHILTALALVQDRVGDRLEEPLRTELRAFVQNKTRVLYEYGTTLKGWWGTSYWQNHCWINFTAVLSVALAFPDFPESEGWKATASEKLKKSAGLQNPDGSNHEGLNYSVYGTVWLMRGLALIEKEEPGMLQKSEYLKNYPEYFMAMSVNEKLDTFFDLGDSPRYLWYNPAEIFLKLYHLHGNPRDLYLYRFYTETYEEQAPGLFCILYGLPLHHSESGYQPDFDRSYFFEDLGLFIDKDAEKGKVQASFLFKSGLPGGRRVYEALKAHPEAKLNISHSHPDQGSFILWTPQGFLIADTGNSRLKKTEDHNTLTVEGRGQLGEGEKWLAEKPYLEKTFSAEAGLTREGLTQDEDYFILMAETADFYRSEAGVDSFNRSISKLPGAGWIIVDRLKFDRPSEWKLWMHSDLSMAEKFRGDFRFSAQGKKAGSLQVLYPPDLKTQVMRKEPDKKANKRKIDSQHVLEVMRESKQAEALVIWFIALEKYDGKQIVTEQPDSVTVSLGEKGFFCQVLVPLSGNAETKFKCESETVKKK